MSNKHPAQTTSRTTGPKPNSTAVTGGRNGESRKGAPSAKVGQEKPAKPGGVEGEGSYTAARRYNEGLHESMARGDSDALAAAAKQALEGAEGDELRRAEAIGKSGHPARRDATPAGTPRRSKTGD